MGNLKIRKCPFCKEWLQFEYVGSHTNLACLTRDCAGHCYISGNNEEEIMKKLKKEKGV